MIWNYKGDTMKKYLNTKIKLSNRCHEVLAKNRRWKQIDTEAIDENSLYDFSENIYSEIKNILADSEQSAIFRQWERNAASSKRRAV